MYKCCECGAVFEEPATWKEYRGEYWGDPAYEEMSGCPECEGGYEEAFECEERGKWCSKDELIGGLCEDCQDELDD